MTEKHALPALKARVRLHHDGSGKAELMGFADLVIGDAFVIAGIRIYRAPARDGKPAGLFIGFPSKKGREGAPEEYYEIAHPVTAQARRAASDVVLAAYERAAGKTPTRA